MKDKDSYFESEYQQAQERYARLGVSTEKVLDELAKVSISMHCWQGDDVSGFESRSPGLESSGLQVTGLYPGKARTLDELRSDLLQAYRLIPGRHRLNLHAMYGDFKGQRVDRDVIAVEHFQSWMEWARQHKLNLDFNATCFGHSLAKSGFTLSHPDARVRNFWIEHVRRCRAISAAVGEFQASPCIHNLWIPDGSKDTSVERFAHRLRLKQSLDTIFEDIFSPEFMLDALESKLFGIGSESFVVGSFDFYLSYAAQSGKMLCLDTGHFHPTESVADKVSAVLQFFPELLLHISRGIRWDSDHVVILNDELKDLLMEVVRAEVLDRVHLALDYFDASMNRVGAWVIGARALLKAVLWALLEPVEMLREFEAKGDFFQRLAVLEDAKTLPAGPVWNYYCLKSGVPTDQNWISEVLKYEQDVLSKRH